jgi:acetyltransferase-like isoleucine patch superfamily enzyme
LPVKIGSGVYIGPDTIITMGVTVGDQCLIGAQSLINKSIPSRSKAWGSPARVTGTVDEYLDDNSEPGM